MPPKPFLSRGPRQVIEGLRTAISLGFGRVIAAVIFLESTAIHGLSGAGSSMAFWAAPLSATNAKPIACTSSGNSQSPRPSADR